MKAFLTLEKFVQWGVVLGMAYYGAKTLLAGKGTWTDIGILLLCGFWTGVIAMQSILQKRIKSLEEEVVLLEEEREALEIGRLR